MKASHVTRDTVSRDIIVSARLRYVTAKDWRGQYIEAAHFWYDRRGKQCCWLRLADRSIALLAEA